MEIEKLENYGIHGVELYFSAVCNLECTYCFQPKLHSHGAKVNEEIKIWLSSGQFIEDIKKYIGENIDYLAFWGGEPSINLPYFVPNFERVLKEFPNITEISFSTNLSTKKLTDNLIEFIKEFDRVCGPKRKFRLGIQISLDGTPKTNDVNRLGSSGEEILNNVTYLLEQTKDVLNRRNIYLHFKNTQAEKGMEYFSHRENLEELYEFYDKKYREWEKITPHFPELGEFLTFVSPGHWTVQDGKNLAKICGILQDPDFKSKFTHPSLVFRTQINGLMRRSYKKGKEVNSSYRGSRYLDYGLSCSVLKTSICLSPNGRMSLCHHSLFFDKDALKEIKERKMLSEFEECSGTPFDMFESRVSNKDDFNIETEFNSLIRTLNCGRQSIANPTLALSYKELMLKQLATCGQIDADPRDTNKIRAYATVLTHSSLNCTMANLWGTGTYSLIEPSYARLLFNGAYEIMMKEIVNE